MKMYSHRKLFITDPVHMLTSLPGVRFDRSFCYSVSNNDFVWVYDITDINIMWKGFLIDLPDKYREQYYLFKVFHISGRHPEPIGFTLFTKKE